MQHVVVRLGGDGFAIEIGRRGIVPVIVLDVAELVLVDVLVGFAFETAQAGQRAQRNLARFICLILIGQRGQFVQRRRVIGLERERHVGLSIRSERSLDRVHNRWRPVGRGDDRNHEIGIRLRRQRHIANNARSPHFVAPQPRIRGHLGTGIEANEHFRLIASGEVLPSAVKRSRSMRVEVIVQKHRFVARFARRSNQCDRLRHRNLRSNLLDRLVIRHQPFTTRMDRKRTQLASEA